MNMKPQNKVPCKPIVCMGFFYILPSREGTGVGLGGSAYFFAKV